MKKNEYNSFRVLTKNLVSATNDATRTKKSETSTFSFKKP